MDGYTASGQKAVTTSGLKTALSSGQGATARTRLEWYEFILSASGAPADNVLNWLIQRCSALGTSTAVTPEPIEGTSSGAATAAAGSNHTVEPTYVAGKILFQNSINQRATFRWVAVPGKGWKVPLVNSEGIGVQVKSPVYTGESEVTAGWAE